jgi:hypothetical protein
MNFIEIIDETGVILYRGENIKYDKENYIFTDILTNSEINIPKTSVVYANTITHYGYENTLSFLNRIKEDNSLSLSDKRKLFKSQNLINDFYQKKIIKLLNIKNYKTLDNIPNETLQLSFKALVDVYFEKALKSLTQLIENENDVDVIAEINSTKDDLENNVKDFIENEISTITKDNIVQKWPTLLNPSPFQQIL